MRQDMIMSSPSSSSSSSPPPPQQTARFKSAKRPISRPLIGSFEENILNNRLEPIRTVDGYTAEVRASCSHFQPTPFKSQVQVSFFSAGDSFPYLGQVHIGHRGYKIPKKGTLQVTLFNPNGTLVKLFLLLYDLADMPPNSQTFLRQKTFFQSVVSGSPSASQRTQTTTTTTNNNNNDNNGQAQIKKQPQPQQASIERRVKYLIQLNIISSKSGRIYLNNDLRIFISKKSDLETASQLVKQDYELKSFDEMPTNPRYFAR